MRMIALVLALLFSASCMQTTEYGISGLATAPNPQVAVPPGALTTADNCVIRRAGMIEPRPGFDELSAIGALSEIWKIIPYDGDYLAVGGTTSGLSAWHGGTALTGATWTDSNAIRGVETRKNLYLTTKDALRKAVGSGSSSAPLAGRPAPSLDVSQVPLTGGPLKTGFSRAYRAVITRTDANGLTTRSAPSARIVVTNSGADTLVLLKIGWSPQQDVAAGDGVELYATLDAAATPPPDELFLTDSYTLVSSDISNGYVLRSDNTEDANLGAALYTNGTQEGINRQNWMPPLGTDLELFQGSLFAANIQWPYALQSVQWNETASGGIATDDGVGTRIVGNCTFTHNSAVVAVSSATGLRVGQLIAPSDFTLWSAQPIRITAISGTNVTMSATYTGSTTPANQGIIVSDALWLSTNANGSSAEVIPIFSARGFLNAMIYGDTTFKTSASAIARAASLFDLDFVGTSYTTRQLRNVYLEAFLPTSAKFYAWATHGNDFFPALPEPAASMPAGTAAAQDAFVNGLTWSKQDEPEHFMRSVLWLVGNAKSPIVRIKATTDALYIFKARGDGIYRLTGFGELSGWRVDRVDDTTGLLHPELVATLENTVYAWTLKGMVQVNATGQEMLSIPILDQTRENEADASSRDRTFGYATANLAKHELIFGLPPLGGSAAAPAKAYVYNELTKAWYTWFGSGLAPYTLAYDPAAGLLRAGRGTNKPLVENATDAVVLNADTSTAITVASCDASFNAVLNASSYVPAVGDLLTDGVSAYAIVTAVTNSTHVKLSNAFTPGAAFAWAAFTSSIEWLPKNPEGAGYLKRFLDVATHWDDVAGLYSYAYTFTAENSNTETLTYTTPSYSHTARRLETLSRPTRLTQLTPQLRIALAITNADARWRISGQDIEFTPQGVRVTGQAR